MLVAPLVDLEINEKYGRLRFWRADTLQLRMFRSAQMQG